MYCNYPNAVFTRSSQTKIPYYDKTLTVRAFVYPSSNEKFKLYDQM